MSVQQNISVDLQTLLTAISTIMPILASVSPAVQKNEQQIKLYQSAASALVPLINSIPANSGLISADEQTAQLNQLNEILSGSVFEKPEWKVQS